AEARHAPQDEGGGEGGGLRAKRANPPYGYCAVPGLSLRLGAEMSPTTPAQPGLPPRDAGNEPRRLEQPVLPFDSRTRALTRVAFAIMAIVLALWVARDFLTAFAWAGLITISCWPLYRRFSARILGGRSPVLSALLFSILTGLVLLVPLAFATHQIAQGSEAFAQS